MLVCGRVRPGPELRLCVWLRANALWARLLVVGLLSWLVRWSEGWRVEGVVWMLELMADGWLVLVVRSVRQRTLVGRVLDNSFVL
mgnify:CR=1 FL=1